MTNISYTLSAADPSRIASVAFTVTPDADRAQILAVRAKLASATDSYSPCVDTPAGAHRWVCPISGVTLAAADQLRLSVADVQTPPAHSVWLPFIRR